MHSTAKKISKKSLNKKDVNTHKSILKSKTFWANALLALVVPFLPDNVKVVIQNPDTLSLIFAGVNVVLRFISTEKVKLI